MRETGTVFPMRKKDIQTQTQAQTQTQSQSVSNNHMHDPTVISNGDESAPVSSISNSTKYAPPPIEAKKGNVSAHGNLSPMDVSAVKTYVNMSVQVDDSLEGRAAEPNQDKAVTTKATSTSPVVPRETMAEDSRYWW